MKDEIIEIPIVPASYEELQKITCDLQIDIGVKNIKIEELQKEKENQAHTIKILLEENERLKEWKEDLLNENIELENIRKEAIEYIKENIVDIEFMENEYDIDFLKQDCIETEYDDIKKLLIILKGEDNND